MLGINAMFGVRMNDLIDLMLKTVLFQHGFIINNVSKHILQAEVTTECIIYRELSFFLNLETTFFISSRIQCMIASI